LHSAFRDALGANHQVPDSARRLAEPDWKLVFAHSEPAGLERMGAKREQMFLAGLHLETRMQFRQMRD
jgi:hypothetical protein